MNGSELARRGDRPRSATGTIDVLTILVVDDEPDILAISAAGLRSARWHVLLAGSGEEALAAAARHRPDAIVLDERMPGMDGPATLGRLRAEPATADIPVIFLTGSAQKDGEGRYRALGAAGVIAKPFDPLALPSAIRRLLDATDPAGRPYAGRPTGTSSRADDLPAPGVLRLIELPVGRPEQRLDADAVLREARDAGAEGDVERLAVVATEIDGL